MYESNVHRIKINFISIALSPKCEDQHMDIRTDISIYRVASLLKRERGKAIELEKPLPEKKTFCFAYLDVFILEKKISTSISKY